MKKNIHAALVVALALAIVSLLGACDNRDNSLGIDYLPDYTKSKVVSEDFLIDFATVSADMSAGGAMPTQPGTSYNSIFVSSSYGYLGTIPNDEYGGISCEYLTQFRCPDGFKFAFQPVNNKIDSVFLTVYYNGYSGDPIAPIEISAYQLNKPLDFNKYSITEVSEYTDLSKLLGKVSFYAQKGSAPEDNQVKAIKIPLSLEFGQKIYDLSVANSPHFANQESFDQFFPGVYLTTSAGSGCVVRVYGTAITFFFQSEIEVDVKDKPGEKKIEKVTKVQELVHTSEVPQLARFANEDLDVLIKKTTSDTDYAYIKSPAGVLTEITIPTEDIRQLLESAPQGYERILNSVQFSILGESQMQDEEKSIEQNTYALPAPSDLLLLPSDSVATFFSRELTDLQRPYTAFLSQKSISASMAYDFGNITSVVLKHLEDKNNAGKDLKLWIVPVDRSVGQTQSGTASTSSISNLVLPSAMKIKADQSNRTIKVFVVERKVGAPF